MTLGPYTYVTIALPAGESPRIGVTFHTADLRVSTYLVDSGRPYLDLCSDEARISISSSGSDRVTDADVALARELHQAAARYLADCERLHAQATKDAREPGS